MLAFRVRAQAERGRHQVGLAGKVEGCLPAVASGPARLQFRLSATGLGGLGLPGRQIPFLVVGAPGGGLPALGGRDRRAGDVEPLPGLGARHSGQGLYGLGEAGFAGPPVDGRAARGLRHPVREREEPLVAFPYPLLGGAPQFGEPLLDRGEPPGVEEPAQELAAGLGVGSQEAGEVALRQEHDLAELLAAHTEELGDLLTDLLVGLAERLPGAGSRVMGAQSALGLLGGEATAPPLGPRLGRESGDLQAAVPHGQIERDLGGGAGRGVVAAQGGAGGLSGAGNGSVQGVADGVEDGGLARAGRSVEEEEAGGRQSVEVDLLGGAEGAEGRDGEAVQSHRPASCPAVSTRTSSKAPSSTVRSSPSGPAPPRTWATKSSAICWSVRSRSRRA